MGEYVIDFGWNVGGTSKKGTLQKDTAEFPDSDLIRLSSDQRSGISDATGLAPRVVRLD